MARKPKYTGIPVADHELLEVLGKAGASNKVISDTLRIPVSVVPRERKYKPRNGVERSALQDGVPVSVKRRQIANLYRNGATLDYLIGRHHTGRDVILRTLEMEGVPVRPARRPTSVEVLRRLRREGTAFADTNTLDRVLARVRRNS